jgi:toxin CcdB
MARELYRLPGLDGLVLNVQADLLTPLATTVVVPLLPVASAPPPMARLNPVFEIEGIRFVMVTQSLAAVARRELGESVGRLGEDRHYDITQALDMLLSGF